MIPDIHNKWCPECWGRMTYQGHGIFTCAVHGAVTPIPLEQITMRLRRFHAEDYESGGGKPMRANAKGAVVCPSCDNWSVGHRIEHVVLFDMNLTVVVCPRMTGWSLVWNDERNAPLWTWGYPRHQGEK